MEDFEKFADELEKINENFKKTCDEITHITQINCAWTRCDDGTHMPTENGDYLIIDTDGNYDVVGFYKQGSVIMTHNGKGYHVDFIVNDDSFMYVDMTDNGCLRPVENVLGYIKISDINVFKVGEKGKDNVWKHRFPRF